MSYFVFIFVNYIFALQLDWREGKGGDEGGD